MHICPETMNHLIQERLTRLQAEAHDRHLLADARRALRASLAPVVERLAARPAKRVPSA